MKNIYKKAQEEMVGFGFIIIIVAVVLIVFLSIAFSGSDDEDVDSFEVESFLQVMMSQTTDCNDGIEYLSIKDLIFSCGGLEVCEDGRISCNVLKKYITEISEVAWNAEGNSDTLGYQFSIMADGTPLIEEVISGNKTANYRGASQEFTKNGENYRLEFKAYS